MIVVLVLVLVLVALEAFVLATSASITSFESHCGGSILPTLFELIGLAYQLGPPMLSHNFRFWLSLAFGLGLCLFVCVLSLAVLRVSAVTSSSNNLEIL